MDWVEMLTQIFEVCIIPLLGVLTAYLVKFINTKSNELKEKTSNELALKYLTMVTETVTNCVIATNQTYVESLKKQGKFDADAQKEAFNRTFEAVKSLLTEEARNYLGNVYEDIDEFLKTLIESAVNQQK